MNNLLTIYDKGGQTIATADKWEFSDTVMGEQFLTMDIKSPTPIQWAVGCYCMYRGQQYSLNYVPNVTQKARQGDSGEAFVYGNIKMESVAEELTRLILLDITETDGEYSPAAGTNYTGSSKFSLYCGEITVGGKTYTPVCVLAEKIYANLKRLNNGWTIHVDITSTHRVNNEDVLNTHTDDKVLSFSNNTIREALEKVNTEFDLDFSIQGRNIYIGYSLGKLTEDDSITYEDGSHPFFHYGYGKGQPSIDSLGREIDGGTALYEIQRTADSSQKIVTRLRAMGSTKNMPYRYYNKKYNLSQSMYPSNLQLPDTFETPAVKAANNQVRKDSGIYPDLRSVLGETNDAYIDKNDNAEVSVEGIREHSAVWDGSDGDLSEIYPTIKEVKYSELRLAGTHDMKDNTPTGDLQNAFVNYSDDDRVDKIAGIGTLANYGNGLLAEYQTDTQGQTKVVLTSDVQKSRVINTNEWRIIDKTAPSVKLFEIKDQPAGDYEFVPASGNMFFEFSISAGRYSDRVSLAGKIGFYLYVRNASGSSLLVDDDGNQVSCYKSAVQFGSSRNTGFIAIEIPAVPDAKEGTGAQVGHIRLKSREDVYIYLQPYYTEMTKNGSNISNVPEELYFQWRVGLSSEQRAKADTKVVSSFTWQPAEAASTYMNTPFDLYIKDFGVQEMQKCFNTDEDAVISMTSGHCVGREFKIVSEVPEQTSITYNGKTVNVWKVRCSRAQDDALQRYYPSETDPISIDDTFVLLNVSMPDPYIKAAEIRLLTAASLYLKDNCDTRYTYQPSIDDIYLQRDYDRCESNGKKEKSIYWRLYAGIKFPFYNIPSSNNESQLDNVAEITIKTVTIKEGEGDTPKVEITLNDTVETSTIKKLTTAIDRIFNGSIFSTGTGGASDIAAIRNQINEYGNKHFLRKDKNDETEYKLTMKEAEVKETLTTKKAVVKDTIASDNFVTGAPTAGSGWKIDHDGNIEGESIKVRGFMEVPEIRFNRASIAVGTNIQSPCAGIIKTVTPDSATSGICTLELGDDDIAGSIVAGDYCWGYFHDITTKSNNAKADSDDHNGTINYQGFATVYFYIQEVLNQNSTQFRYELKEGTTLHPYVGMHFGGRGNDKDKTRQGFTITTPRYLAIYQLVTGWDWDAASHIVYLQGCLDGFEALANVEAGTWQNKYGIICGDIYFRGTQHQVNANKRYIYITQTSNGMIDPGETETVTIAIRDNYFRTRTEEFTVKVNGTAQTKADEITLTYAYDDLTAEVTKFTIEATDGTYTLTSAFTIRKNPQRTLSIVTNTDNDPFIDQIEPKHIVCTVKNNLGYDLTEQVTKWQITRESSSADADAIWAQRSKVKAFNGTIDLYWSDDVTINDLDLTQPTTKFHITATIGEETLTTTLSI